MKIFTLNILILLYICSVKKTNAYVEPNHRDTQQWNTKNEGQPKEEWNEPPREENQHKEDDQQIHQQEKFEQQGSNQHHEQWDDHRDGNKDREEQRFHDQQQTRQHQEHQADYHDERNTMQGNQDQWDDKQWENKEQHADQQTYDENNQQPDNYQHDIQYDTQQQKDDQQFRQEEHLQHGDNVQDVKDESPQHFNDRHNRQEDNQQHWEKQHDEKDTITQQWDEGHNREEDAQQHWDNQNTRKDDPQQHLHEQDGQNTRDGTQNHWDDHQDRHDGSQQHQTGQQNDQGNQQLWDNQQDYKDDTQQHFDEQHHKQDNHEQHWDDQQDRGDNIQQHWEDKQHNQDSDQYFHDNQPDENDKMDLESNEQYEKQKSHENQWKEETDTKQEWDDHQDRSNDQHYEKEANQQQWDTPKEQPIFDDQQEKRDEPQQTWDDQQENREEQQQDWDTKQDQNLNDQQNTQDNNFQEHEDGNKEIPRDHDGEQDSFEGQYQEQEKENKQSTTPQEQEEVIETQPTFHQNEEVKTLQSSPDSFTPPNIVIFLARDVRSTDLGCYGNATSKTPNLDRLATDGLKLTRHFAAALTDTAGRAAFYTGRLPVRYGMSPSGQSDEIETLASKTGLPEDEQTFANILQSQDYESALIGTWNLGINCNNFDDNCHHPISKGFSYFFGIPLFNKYSFAIVSPVAVINVKPIIGVIVTVLLCMALRKVLGCFSVAVMILAVLIFGAWSYFCLKNPHLWSSALMKNTQVTEVPVNWKHVTKRLVANGNQFLRDNSSGERKKLLVMSWPHIHPHMEEIALSPGGRIEELDWAIGQILQTLSEMGMDRNTLIYFTSTLHGASNPEDADSLKHIMAPGLLRWTGTLRAGDAVPSVTSQLDILPTIAHFSKSPLKSDRMYDGINLAEHLLNPERTLPPRFIPLYCGGSMWSLTLTSETENEGYIGHFFEPTWNLDPFYCTSPESPRSNGNKKLLPERIYKISEGTNRLKILPKKDDEFKRTLKQMQRSAEAHIFSLKGTEDQYTWYKQSWHAYLQPVCKDGSYTCSEGDINQ